MVKLKNGTEDIKLYINDIERPLKFTIDIALEAEKRLGSFADIFKEINLISKCVSLLAEMVNAAIRAYNAEYNDSEKPITADFVISQIDTQYTGDVAGIIRKMVKLLTGDLPKDDEKNAVTEQEGKS